MSTSTGAADTSDTQPFYFTTAAVVIPAITGSMSFLSSGTIIYVIVRSKIYSTYHRIMLGTSIADCLTSLAIALTTLPMPKDVIYPFAGRSFGNIATCEAQGLVYLSGSTFVFCMSFLLNVFYLCTLTRWFRLKEEKFKWFVEAPFFLASLLSSLLIPLVYFESEVINPTPNDTFCSIYTYPQGCNKDDNPSCRGDVVTRGKFTKAYVPIMFITFTTLIVTMILIVLSFHQNERGLRLRTATGTTHFTSSVETDNKASVNFNTSASAAEESKTTTGDHDSSSMDVTMLRTFHRAQETKRIVTRQAIMYILAFFFSHGFTVLSYMDLRLRNYSSYTEWIAILRIIFQPLQGFFNMLIFLHHKVHSIRRDNPHESFVQALRTVFLTPKTVEDPIVSSIEIVMMDDYLHRKGPVRPLRRTRRDMDAPDNGSKILEDPASYFDHLSISEMEESVNSEFDYVSRVNDASFNGSQPTIHSFVMNDNVSLHTGPSSGSAPTVESP